MLGAQPPVQEQLQFHRLLRGIPKYKWWKPAVFGLLVLFFGFTLTQIVVTIAVIPMMLQGDPNALLDFQARITRLDTQDPFALGMSLASLAVWIPAVLFAAWAVGFKPVGRVWSVAFKIRWALLFKSVGPALLALIFAQTVGMLYVALTHTGEVVTVAPPQYDASKALISLVLILLLVPLQSAAEELIFRGAFMQILGAWLKSPIIPIVLPSLLFAMAHIYDPWALVQVGLLGLVAGWLTWRTGGLEAAIALHVINNLVVFLLLLSGVTGETHQVQETGGDLIVTLIQAASFALYGYLVLRITHKMGITMPLKRKVKQLV